MEKFRLYKKFDEPIGFMRKLIDEERTWFQSDKDMKETWGLSEDPSIKRMLIDPVSIKDIWG